MALFRYLHWSLGFLRLRLLSVIELRVPFGGRARSALAQSIIQNYPTDAVISICVSNTNLDLTFN